MATIDVLIPTFGRKTGLAIVLTSLLGQTFRDFSVTIADQTRDDAAYLESAEIRTLLDALRWHGHRVVIHRRPERRGLAEQRDFLLGTSSAPFAHYLDDDVVLDPDVLERMLRVMQAERCGFVGAAAAGLGYLADERPHQQQIELWDGPVRPEPFEPGTVPEARHLVNNAANPLHLERKLVPDGSTVRYKVAWVGAANVLFDRAKLLAVGGFSFWRDLPSEHAGEEALVEYLLVRRFGGCAILPCGTYHLCLPTTVQDRRVNATSLLPALLARESSHA